jgi:hypothetical protein
MEFVKVSRLVNFSHALSPAARARLEEMVGPVLEVVIPCQIDMDAPIKPQLDMLVEQAGNSVPDLYIPPALSFAAAYVTAKLSYAQSDAMLPVPPAMVVLRREGTPPQFMPYEIVRG